MKLRIRTIKPELLKHEKLFDIEKETGIPARIAWAGLFTACDREGRFEWRPRILKAEILPYDEGVNFEILLDAWARERMLYKYEINGTVYGWIPTFATRHQQINNKESPSEFPPHPNEAEIVASLTRDPRVNDANPDSLDPSQGKLDLSGVEGELEREGELELREGRQPPNPVLDFGRGPFPVDPEIATDPATVYVVSHSFPAEQTKWVEKYGPTLLNESLAKAIRKKLRALKTEDPRRHSDWPGYLENWFKKERGVKFIPKPARVVPPAAADPPPPTNLAEVTAGAKNAKKLGLEKSGAIISRLFPGSAS